MLRDVFLTSNSKPDLQKKNPAAAAGDPVVRKVVALLKHSFARSFFLLLLLF